MNLDELSQKISQGNTTALAQAITLVESTRVEDWDKTKKLLSSLKTPGQTKRLGFSGPPGVGKSTLIEKIGLSLTKKQKKVAVLAIDPSSEITGGSILGDKTRMEELSRSQMAFVRPSPSRGHLGGVTSTLPGVIQLCEAAGYEWILIESVGVGQSEIELSKMVDFFTLLSQPGAGDELQGIKKGILEYVDLIAVNKADRDTQLVNTTRQQYLAALKIVRGVEVKVEACSGLSGQGVDELVAIFENYFSQYDYKQRREFDRSWFESLIYSEFRKRVFADKKMKDLFTSYGNQVGHGQTSPVEAVDQFFKDLGLGS